MSTVTTFPYDSAGNYTFTATDVEVTGSVGTLLLQEAAQVFNEDFADDTDFTYDSAKAEFTAGLVRQVDQAPSGVLGIGYTSDQNLSWAISGSLVGTLNGTPTISGGKLVCTGAQGVYYDNTNVVNAGAGAIKFRYTPNYTGAPPANIDMIVFRNSSSSNKDRIGITHSPSGSTIRLWLYDSTGTSIYVATGIGPAFSPTAGTSYEIELNWDPSGGVARLFIDGALHGVLSPGAWTRGTSADRLHVGASIYNRAEASFDDVILYSSVQHTTAYTAGYTLPVNKFVEASVILPEFSHTGPGSLLTLTSLSTTDVGVPKFTLQLDQSGTELWWSGVAWVTSNGTYAEANTKADISANLGTLDVDGELYVQVTVYFQDSSTLSSLSDLTLNYTGNSGYLTTNPTILTNATVSSTKLTGFTEDGTVITGSDAVRHVLQVDGQNRWWNGSAWADSDGTYAQSSTASDINTNAESLISSRSTIKVLSFLHSDDGSTRPELDSVTITFDSADSEATEPTLVNLEGYIYDNDGPVSGQALEVRSATGHIASEIFVLREWRTLATTDSDGYFFGKIWASVGSADYELRIGTNRYSLTVPNQDTVNLSTLTLTRITQ